MLLVTKEQLREIWREYLDELVQAHGGVKAFSDKTGIKHAQVSRAASPDDTAFVTLEMLVRIDRSGVQRLGMMYEQIAERCDAFARKESRARPASSPIREPWMDYDDEPGASEGAPPLPPKRRGPRKDGRGVRRR